MHKEVDLSALTVYYVAARITACCGTNMTRHCQKVRSNTRQVALHAKDTVSFVMYYEIRRFIAKQADPLPYRLTSSTSPFP